MPVNRYWLCASCLLALALPITVTANEGLEQEVVKLSITDQISAERVRLLSLPGVVGVGEGVCEENPCIILFLSSPPDDSDLLPEALGDYQVEWVITGGEFKAR